MDFVSKLPFARNRVAEAYFWALAVYFEPEHALARMITCKFVPIVTVVDDIYDVYGTYEELELFTEAIERFKLNLTNYFISSIIYVCVYIYVISSFKIS